jgi:uncharacterized membrane protein YdjX (TVP38/TMEM64 family)
MLINDTFVVIIVFPMTMPEHRDGARPPSAIPVEDGRRRADAARDRAQEPPMTRGGLPRIFPTILLIALTLAACARIPTAQEANEAVLVLRDYGDWAWAIGIGLIWLDLFLPVPQTAVIAALGIVYGAWLGGAIGSFALISSGLLGYALMLTSLRGVIQRLAGTAWLERMERLFEAGGAWAIIVTRSLPHSIPELIVFLAGLARMPIRKFLVAMTLGSVPTGFVFAAIGAGLADQPFLALVISYVLPIVLLPLALWAMPKGAR